MGEPCAWGWVSIVYGFCVGRCGYVELGCMGMSKWVVRVVREGWCDWFEMGGEHVL